MLSRPLGNILDLIVTKVEEYAAISFEDFEAQKTSSPKADQARKNGSGPSNPTSIRPVNQPGSRSPVANSTADRLTVQDPNSHQNAGPSGSRPAASGPTKYLKEWQTASIIRQVAEAVDYPQQANNIIASHHNAVGNADPVLKSLLELESDLKALSVTSTAKRNINKWAKSAGYQP